MLLFSGLFMGWSLGTNDAANAFGTAVASRVVKYRTSIIIIAVMVILGSILQGADDIGKLSSISTNNEVSADIQDIENVGFVYEKGYLVQDNAGNYYFLMSQDAVDKTLIEDLEKVGVVFEKGEDQTYLKDESGYFIVKSSENASLAEFKDITAVKLKTDNESISLLKKNNEYLAVKTVKNVDDKIETKITVSGIVKNTDGSYIIKIGDSICKASADEIVAAGISLEKVEYIKDTDGAYVLKYDDRKDDEKLSSLRLKSTIKAAIIFVCAALTVFIMSYLKFPVSANQSVTGAIIGWGLFHADYSNPDVRSTNLTEIIEFASTWILNPLGAALIAYVIVFLFKKFFEAKVESLKGYDKVIKIGYICAGAFSAYTIGINSSASVTAFYYDSFGIGANLLTSARLTALIGGIAIAVGVLTYSKKVMMTVGSSIANISQIDGFLVILSSALAIVLMKQLMGIPVSTSQAVVGAVIGAGLVKGPKNVNFGVLGRIAIAWVSSPTAAGLMTYIVALCTQKWLA